MRRALLALAGGAVFFAVWVGPRFKKEEKVEDNFDNLVCAVGAPCSPTWRDFEYDFKLLTNHGFAKLLPEQAAELTKALSDRCDALAEASSTAVVLHVGVHRFDEYEEYNELLANVRAGHRLLLVEPNPHHVPDIEERAKLVRSPTQVISAAVCPESGRHMTLHSPLKETILEDFLIFRTLHNWGVDVGVERLTQIASLDYETTALGLRQFYGFRGVSPRHIQNISVACLTPVDLLASVGASPGDVAQITVDTEGFDAQLLSMFLEVPTFRPAVVKFEWFGHHNNETDKVDDFARVVRTLHAKGYEVRKDGENMVARAPPSS